MEETQGKSPEQIQHESNKMLRERLGHAHYIMSYQCKYLPEQFDEVQKTLKFIAEVCQQLQERIEVVEPPAVKAEEAPKKPYVMDVPMQSSEATQ